MVGGPINTDVLKEGKVVECTLVSVNTRYACAIASSKFSSSGLCFIEATRSWKALFSSFVWGIFPSC